MFLGVFQSRINSLNRSGGLFVNTQKVSILLLATILATAITFSLLTWTLMQPPKNTVRINIGLTPIDIYPIKTGNWKITIQLGGYHNKSYNPPLNADYYIATNGETQLSDWNLYGLIQQIMQHDGTAPYG